MKRKFSFMVLVSFTVFSCSGQTEPPENLVAEDTYINLMIELQLIRSYQAQSQADSAAIDSLMRAVFNKYGVTKKQFKQSHAYYQDQLEEQTDRIDIVIERLRKDRIHRADSTAKDSLNT